MVALPVPPAPHQCRKSHCSSKSARWQNWTRCDLTDHCKGSEQAVGVRTPVVVSGGGSPTCLQMGQSCWQRQHSTCALLELQLLPSQHLCCWDKPLPRQEPSSSHQASPQPQQTCHKLLACSHPAWPGAQSHWESGPTSHVLHEAGSECGQELHTSRLLLGLFLWISQPLASLMHPGHSAFELQHFLELAPSK